MKLNFYRHIAFLSLAGATALTLPGCAAVADIPMAHAGGVTSDILRSKVAKSFGVDQSDVTISNVERKSNGLFTADSTYFDATIKGKPQHCYVTTSIGGSSDPLCADPGKDINTGSYNALTKAARQQGLVK